MSYFKTHKILFILILVLGTLDGLAQEELNSTTVENKSYQLYTDKKWDELITFGNQEASKGYTYFYLQLRVGIAYFEKKNYSLAENHFKKALNFNSDDALTQEYLYYCYVYNGRNEEAKLLSKGFNAELAEKIGTNKQSPIEFITIEGGIKKSDSTSYYNKTLKNHSTYFNPAAYFQIGLNHSIKKSFSLFHSATYFNQKSYTGTVTQLQYYLKAGIPLKHNFVLSPSFHLVNTNLKAEYTTSSTQTYTLWPPGVPPNSTPPPGAPAYQTTTAVTNTTATSASKSSNVVLSVALQKTINKFTVSAGTTFASLNSSTQMIHTGFASYSVFGNSKLVVGTNVYAHTNDSYSTTYLACAPFIYFQPLSKLFFKVSYLQNVGKNIIEDNGYMVNNSLDLTKSRWSVLANVTLSKHVSLYGVYVLEYKKDSYQSFNYQYNIFVGGIKITP